MKRSLIVPAFLAAATLGLGAPVAAWAADSGASAADKASCCAGKGGPHQHGCADMQGCGDKQGCIGKDGCCDHKGMSPEMAAKMAEMDKRMDDLAAKMNSAKGDEKVDAMAAVLNEMLARHKAMRDRMRAHHGAGCGAPVSGGEAKEEGLLGDEHRAP